MRVLPTVMSSGKKIWTAPVCEELIEKCRDNPCLWDVKSEQYKHRIARDEVLSSIASHFNIPKIEISRKLHNIRSQYSNERAKIRRLATPGSAATVSSKWQHFATLDFLGDSIEARPSKLKISEEPEGEHKEDHISSREPQLRKRKAKKDSFNDLLQLAENQLRKKIATIYSEKP